MVLRPTRALSLLEVVRIDPTGPGVAFEVTVDDEESERAYAVSFVYDLTYGPEQIQVTSWWSTDLHRQELTATDAPMVTEIERFIECEDELYFTAKSARIEYRADVEACR